ncbi:hypothetical protein [Faecalibacillus intestinalis]|uniref:hypothetical protein n=1 Tax=Faecalibacillus intestinalis TaxID=1982626 RepID=UPI0022DF4893|nr:hypothetical protein [Faecalibacillus intestinalis]
MSVISPWLFYIIDLLDKLREVAIIVFWIIVVTIFITGFIALLEGEYWEDKIIQKLKKALKLSVIPIVISSVMYVAIPSKDVMYKMLVSKYVTYENIDKATNTIKDGVDYIFEKLDGGKDKDK